MRDNLVWRLSKSEDKLPNDHPRTEGLRDKLIRADDHLRGQGYMLLLMTVIFQKALIAH